MSIFNSKEVAPDLDVVKNVVIWSLSPGEIARRINVNEFEHLSSAKGVYVQAGVTAVLMVNGIIKTKLSSGVYYFESKIETFGDALRHVWRFFTGRKKEGSGGAPTDSGRLGSELQNLGKGSLVDVILVSDAAIPVVFGVAPTEDGIVFKPYVIKAGYSNVEIGLSMQLEIDDIPLFARNYVTKNISCRIVDIQLAMREAIENVLSSELAYENVDTQILSPALVSRLKSAIAYKVNSTLYGIRVKQVVDITMSNEDFDRFRDLERKLSLSKKELDYLIRTNDFKNRLAAEQNSQVVREARSEEDLRYALNLLNKDKLLHDDEMEAFCQLLASQKKLREAKTSDELEAALLEIKKSKLIRDDDFADLELELKKHDLARNEDFEILQYQSLRRTERERISVMSDVRVMLAKAEKEGEQAEYEAAKQEQGHKHEIQESEAEHETRMAGHEVNTQQVHDKYGDERWEIEHQHEQTEANDEIENARKWQEVALAGLAAIKEEGRKDKAQDYDQIRILKEMDIDLEKAKLEATRGMTPEQIASTNIDKLSPEAQVALAAAFSSQKEVEWLKVSAEERIRIIQELAEKSSAMDKESRAQQERTLAQMMEFAKEAIKTNASLVAGAVAGQREQAENILSAVTGVAKHRIDEVESDKREAKEAERHAQSRLDHTQDSALHYTTQVTSDGITGDAIKGAAGNPGGPISYIVISLGSITVGLADMIALINAGTVTPDMQLSVNGEIYKISERPEFKPSLDAKYGTTCPNCGAFGYKGYSCPECGRLL